MDNRLYLPTGFYHPFFLKYPLYLLFLKAGDRLKIELIEAFPKNLPFL